MNKKLTATAIALFLCAVMSVVTFYVPSIKSTLAVFQIIVALAGGTSLILFLYE